MLLAGLLAGCGSPPLHSPSRASVASVPEYSSPYYSTMGYPKYGPEDYRYEKTKERKDGNVYTTTTVRDPDGQVVSERTSERKIKNSD